MASRRIRLAGLFAASCVAATIGCSSPFLSTTGFWGEDKEAKKQAASDAALTELKKKGKRVGDLTYPWQLTYLKLESDALVNGLRGTGSSPPAGAMRDRLKKEMQTHKVSGSDRIIDSDDTSMVMARVRIPPAAKRGDRLDVEVVVPMKSETTSLAGGWLMPSRMTPRENFEGELHEGEVLARADGLVLVDALFERDPSGSAYLKGWVLGGAEALRDREIGLQIRTPDLKSAQAIFVAKAINARFSANDGTRKVGAAAAQDARIVKLPS